MIWSFLKSSNKQPEADWRKKALVSARSRQYSTFEWALESCRKHLVDFSKNLNNKVVYEKRFSGYFDLKYKDDIIAFFTAGRKKILVKYDSDYTSNDEDTVLISKNSVVSLGFSAKNNVTVSLATSDLDFLANATEFMETKITKRPTDNMGKAHVLVTSYDGLMTKELGSVGIPLQLENYASESKEGISKIITELRSPIPKGKLTIIEGEPGVGKTFLIRSLISEIPNAFFVIIPPAMVAKLGDPSMVPVLLRLKAKDPEMTDEELMQSGDNDSSLVSSPVVMIVEDGDECLVKRGADNMGSMSSVLNLTSGILGDMLDVRIIATTNARKEEMDPAIYRDGRLSCHLNIDRLSPDEATAVYRRLTKDDKVEYQSDNKPVLLASVYAAAKDIKCDTSFSQEEHKQAASTTKSYGATTRKRRAIGFVGPSKDPEEAEGPE